MTDKFILNGHEVVPVTDLNAWGRWLQGANRRVAVDFVGADDDDNQVRVSTMFLGLDHSFGEGPPLLFETMVFGGALDQEMDRYSTWEQAEAGHAAMLERARSVFSAHPSTSQE